MIVLGIILIVVGAALGYFFPDQIVRFAAFILVIGGLVLVLLGVLDTSDVNVDEGVWIVK